MFALPVDYTNKDIDADRRHREELIRRSGGTSIAYLEIGGQAVRGYAPARIDELLAGGRLSPARGRSR